MAGAVDVEELREDCVMAGAVDVEELREDCAMAGAVDKEAEAPRARATTCPLSYNLQEAAKKSDVIIDFSTKTSTPNVIAIAKRIGKPVVCGVTGLPPETHALIKNAANTIPIFYSENFSIGIAAICEAAKQLAQALQNFDVEIVEMHHAKKKDAPSGTALKLGRVVAAARQQTEDAFCFERYGDIGERKAGQIGFAVVRGGSETGTHTIHFLGEDETISITHHGASKSIFAKGAIAAAKLLRKAPPRLYTKFSDIAQADQV
jgi:4-hydroxy-tetrahydrodipicolinate reductase